MDAAKQVQIVAEVTPNPHTLKFNVSRVLLEQGSINFPDKAKAKGSPLAEKLFEVASVLGVMVGRDFITVTKSPNVEWPSLVAQVTETIKSLLATEQVLFSENAPSAAPGNAPKEGDVEKKIKEILDNEIRPAVAMDGGDIVFYGYHNGVVTLHLQGSCSSCPSSIMTLKMGVENRLKQSIPEVKEVVQV